MEQKAGHITKNTFYLTFAFVVKKLLAFVYFALLARYLGAEQIGQYLFALSFTAIFAIFVDLGIYSVLIREIAKYREKASSFLNSILTFRIILCVFVYLLIIILLNLLNYPSAVKNLVYLSGLVMILDSFSNIFYAVFRGLQNLKYESIGIIVFEIIMVVLGGAAILLKLPLFAFLLVILVSSFFNFIFPLILLFKKANLKIKLKFDPAIIKMLLKISIPFAIAGLFSTIYTYIDSVLLSKLASYEAVGFYSVANKLTFALVVIPSAFAASIFPAFSHCFVYSQEKLKQVFEKSMRYLIIIALPISAFTIVSAQELIEKLYGVSYIPSILSLQILISALVLIFLSYPLSSILNACDKQKIHTFNLGITMGLNIILNILLIPKYSFLGASAAVLISYFLLIIMELYWATKIINYDKMGLVVIFLKTLFIAILSAGFIYYFKSKISFIFLLVPAGLIYLLLAWLTRVLTKEDFLSIKHSLFNRTLSPRHPPDGHREDPGT